MIGSIIGGALKVGGSIFGGIAGAKSAKRQKEMIEARQQANEDWFNRRYNEDATQRADAQRMLTQTAEAIKNRNKSIAGRSAVMGGDDASIAQDKALNAQAMANATSNIVALGEARKDSIEQQYQTKADTLADALLKVEQDRVANIKGAVQGVAEAGSGIANAFQIPGADKTTKS